MRLGAVFPQTESGTDINAIRDYVQAVEDLGFEHLGIYDHILGADSTVRPGWNRPYDHESLFHEPFVLYGYLAAFTTRLELETSIVILPQRQTVLVAKQAAEIDLLTGGRFRLGVGIGWNEVEYEGQGENFRNRGRRVEEQIEVLRALWTQPVVNFQGKWHRITAAGIKPLPVQRPIPVWMGGGPIDPVLRRVARLADGWYPMFPPDETGAGHLARLRDLAREAGRDPSTIGIEARMSAVAGTEEDWAGTAAGWKQLGATHLSLTTHGAKLPSLSDHIAALERAKAVLGDGKG